MLRSLFPVLVAGLGAGQLVACAPPSPSTPAADLDGGPGAAGARAALRNWQAEAEHPCEALVVARGEAPLWVWGRDATRYNTHSVRKSLLSALFGIAIERGLIDPQASLADLGIDESATPLTPTELSATVLDLLTSQSGIYLQAGGETQGQRDGRPGRGSHPPGSFYFYNNWDFNTLGAIFEGETGLGIGEAFGSWIAAPLGMQDFRPQDVYYEANSDSDYPQYIIRLSARDLARFGVLYLQDGEWDGEQVVPQAWVRESLQPLADMRGEQGAAAVDAFGYSWWIDSDDGLAWSLGWGGQNLLVDRAAGLVTVSRNNTGRSKLEYGWLIATGHPDRGANFCHPQINRDMTRTARAALEAAED